MGAVWASGAAVLAFGAAPLRQKPLPEFTWVMTLTALLALTEYFPLLVGTGATSVAVPVAMAAAFILDPLPAAWVAALGIAVSNLARGRAPRVIAFNAAQYALGTALGGWAARAAHPPPDWHWLVEPAVFAAVFYATSNLVTDGLLLLRLPKYPFRQWWDKTRAELFSALATLAYGMLMLLVGRGMEVTSLGLVYLFAPVVAMGAITHALTNLRRLNHRLKALFQASLQAARTDGVSGLEGLLSRLTQVIDHQVGIIYLAQPDGTLEAVAVRGADRAAVARRAMGEGIAGWVAERNQPVLLADATRDPRVQPPQGQPGLSRSVLAVPVVAQDRLLGVIILGRGLSHSFQAEDQQLLTVFAGQVAVAVQAEQAAREREQLAVIEERNRLGREMHDRIAQSLTGVVLQIEHLERQSEPDPGILARRLPVVRERLRETLREVRRSIANLRPGALEVKDLAAALADHAADLARQHGIPVECAVKGQVRPLSTMVEEAACLIGAEALTNACRHARPSQVRLTLEYGPEVLRLQVVDDGAGFHLAETLRATRRRGRFGLMGINERVQRLGGTLDIESRPGAGTRLTATVPLAGE